MFWVIDNPAIFNRFKKIQKVRKKEPKDICHFDIIEIDSKTDEDEINEIAAGILKDLQEENPLFNHFKICENGDHRSLDLKDLPE